MICCPACFDEADYAFNKCNVDYWQCIECETLFSEPLSNDNMVGGTNEPVRNNNNRERIERLKKHGSKILDYGCGNGLLVNDLLGAGLDAQGYDKFNPMFDKLPNATFDVVSMIEVIEHLSYPFEELDEIRDILKPGGVVYIETSFVDIAKEFEISLKEYEYVNPTIGHATIFSHKGLDILMRQIGFVPINHLNRNVRQYKKI